MHLLRPLQEGMVTTVSWALLLGWVTLFGIWLFAFIELQEFEVVLVLFGVFAASALTYLGKGTLTAWFGATVIGVGAFAFISEIVANGLFALIEPVRILALALIFTGIVLERVSPKPPLQPWMFMLIAAKAEFIMISSLMVYVLDAGHALLEASVVIWWILVFLMLVSALAFAFEIAALYKVVWYSSLAVSASLLFVLLPILSFSSVGALWALAATVWPPVAVQLVQRKTTI